ncbi:MAG: polysaccharide deacetylase family protein [Anaerolineae bacterium]|nr:polysaccharide deacetylase family protein [Anaerolineae bacterium]
MEKIVTGFVMGVFVLFLVVRTWDFYAVQPETLPTPIPTPTTAPTIVTNTPIPTVTVIQPSPTLTPSPAPFSCTGEIAWGDRTRNIVVFTFDAGSGNQSTIPVLETLEEHNLTATFFITGTWANSNQELLRQISEAGHEIYNHTYTHPHLTQISDKEIRDELTSTNELIESITGNSTTPFFRPPYGERNQHVLDVALAEGYCSVYWTVDALDWKESEGVTSEQVKARIFNNLNPGTIYLMHLGDNITGQILDEVITHVQSQGFEILPLSKGI